MPAITVAVTAYNLEKYIKVCLDELKDQTFQDFEILIYDDCSSDGTRKILASIQESFGERLHVILGTVPQRLPAKARNKILDSGLIHGKYLIFLDGDDNIQPDFLEKLYEAAERTNADMTLCAYDRFEDETGHILCQEMRGYPEVISVGEQGSHNLAFVNTSLWNKMIRTDRIGSVRMPEFSVGEDACFLWAVYMGCRIIACVDEVLIHYRVRQGSVISNTPEDSIYCFAKELHRLWQLSDNPYLKDDIGLAAFVHIGISMPLRAHDNPNIPCSSVLKWIRRYFADAYRWFSGNQCLRFSYLLKLGVKGLGCWCVLICHKLGCVPLFLWAYKFITEKLNVDFKF